MNQERKLHKFKALQEANAERVRTLANLGFGVLNPMDILALRVEALTVEMADKWGKDWLLDHQIHLEECMSEILAQALNSDQVQEKEKETELEIVGE